jgi:primosomal protein N' (replication factor Y)
VAAGWARPLTGSPEALRQAAPLVRAAPDEAELARDSAAMTARLPSLALRAARSALSGDARGAGSAQDAGNARGPVLVQVPRRGYLAAIACGRCRAQARCAKCSGPMQISGSQQAPDCRWCGALAADWTCPRCGSGRLRALVTGAARTAEELGRAFPGVPVRASGGDHVLATVPAEPALVIATPGAEPVAAGGYAAALLLDGWALLGRPSLRAAEEALRRWMNAAALVRPSGTVIVLAEASLPAVQALIRWDPAGFSERELAERAELSFPPAIRMAAVTGTPEALADFLAMAALPPQAEVLGPVPAREPAGEERALIRIRRHDGLALARALHAAQATRSARKDGGAVRVQLDPAEVA